MAGWFPRYGLAPGVSNSGIDFETATAEGCDARYYNEQCAQKFDPIAMNRMISELVSVINACPVIPYDCARKDNLLRALQCLFGVAESTTIGLLVRGANAQTIPSGVITKITSFAAPVVNDFGGPSFFGGIFTVPPGYQKAWYTITGVWFSGSSPGGASQTWSFIYVNNVGVAYAQDTNETDLGYLGVVPAQIEMQLSPGDTVQLAGFHNSSGATTSGASSYMSIIRHP